MISEEFLVGRLANVQRSVFMGTCAGRSFLLPSGLAWSVLRLSNGTEIKRVPKSKFLGIIVGEQQFKEGKSKVCDGCLPLTT